MAQERKACRRAFPAMWDPYMPARGLECRMEIRSRRRDGEGQGETEEIQIGGRIWRERLNGWYIQERTRNIINWRRRKLGRTAGTPRSGHINQYTDVKETVLKRCMGLGRMANTPRNGPNTYKARKWFNYRYNIFLPQKL